MSIIRSIRSTLGITKRLRQRKSIPLLCFSQRYIDFPEPNDDNIASECPTCTPLVTPVQNLSVCIGSDDDTDNRLITDSRSFRFRDTAIQKVQNKSINKYRDNIRLCSSSSQDSNNSSSNSNKSNSMRNILIGSICLGGIAYLFRNNFSNMDKDGDGDGQSKPNSTLVFQLGSFPWAAVNEPTSGSAILHQSHHKAMNNLPNVKSFSIFPSGYHLQKNDPSVSDVRVLELDTDVPKYSHSSWRWSTIDRDNYNLICNNYFNLAYNYMLEIEEIENKSIDLLICHHTFMNVIIAMKIMEKRRLNGLNVPYILSFLHGTAMKMYQNEISGEWDSNHYQTMIDSSAFNHPNKKGFVNLLLSNSTSITDEMLDLFPGFDRKKVVLAYPGYNPTFKYIPSSQDLTSVLNMDNIALTHIDCDGNEHDIPNLNQYKYLILVVGKLASWKRFDAVIKAAEIYEKEFGNNEILTLIVGKQLRDENNRLQTLNDSLNTSHVYFPGPKMQPELVHLYNAASIGVFPSKNEPFGLVLIECLACGTPVIGANSGGPKDFITKDIGGLVDESDDIDIFSKKLANMIIDSVKNNWKNKMQNDAINKSKPFTIESKLKEMIDDILNTLPDQLDD